MNGIALHGGTRVFGGTFLTFSDYMRPSVRLAALMGIPVTYVWTHDSIGLGEDGPTHQPIEHLAALRAIPGLDVVRPADANEVTACWKAIMEHTDRPAGLALTRQNVPVFPRGVDGFADTSDVHRGGYVLLDADGGQPDVVLIGTGSEVQLAVEARTCSPRTASAPGWSRCRAGSGSPSSTSPTGRRSSRRSSRPGSSVEAGIAQGWHEVVGDHGRIVSIDTYGASAEYSRIYRGVRHHRARRRRRRTRQHPGGDRLRPGRRPPIPIRGGTHERSTAGARRRGRVHLARRPLARAASRPATWPTWSRRSRWSASPPTPRSSRRRSPTGSGTTSRSASWSPTA